MKKILTLIIITTLLTGCDLIHTHKYKPANYQQASTCEECGNTKGIPLIADFDKYKINEFVTLDKEYEYLTLCSDMTELEESVYTIGKVIFTNYYSFESDQTHQTKKGYKWQHVEIKIDFSDENCQLYGADYAFFMSDYYDIEAYQNSYNYDESKSSNVFTVNYYGQDYTDCVCETLVNASEWVKKNGNYYTTLTISFNVLLPEGYDGYIVGIRNSDIDLTNKTYFNEYYDNQKCLCYRLTGE